MGSLLKLWAALKSLAANVEALSSTVAETNDGLRAKIGLRKIVVAQVEAKPKRKAKEVVEVAQ